MKYVHLVESFSTGVFTWLQDVVAHQLETGNEVAVLYSIREETPANWRALFPEATQFVHVPMTRNVSPVDDFRAILKIREYLSQCQPDVLHLHSSKAGVLGRVAAVTVPKSPTVFYTPHGLSFLRQDIPPRKRFLFKTFERISAWLPGRVLACSNSEREALAAIVQPARLGLLNNAINCRALDQMIGADLRQGSKPDSRPRGLRICTLGGIRFQKAPWVFSAVVREFSRRHPDADVGWVWIGAGDPEYEKVLWSEGVEVTGWIPRADAIALISSCDIYLQTSLWEGLPLSVLEAQYLGLPVVATNCGGNNDVVVDGVTGVLAKDVNGFVAGVEALVFDSASRSEVGHRAKERVLAHFDLPRMLDELDTIYATDVKSARGLRNTSTRVMV